MYIIILLLVRDYWLYVTMCVMLCIVVLCVCHYDCYLCMCCIYIYIYIYLCPVVYVLVSLFFFWERSVGCQPFVRMCPGKVAEPDTIILRSVLIISICRDSS